MITEKQAQTLNGLRNRIGMYMKEKRLQHTLAVEREIETLSGIFLPEAEFRLRCAALLHDITKELSLEKQLQICEEFDIIYTRDELAAPKIFHSRTAPAIIERDFGEFADEMILSAVRWHTTGRDQMTVSDSLLFLADYIEDTRTFDSCVRLRSYFYGELGTAADMEQKLNVLFNTMVLAFDMTVRELTDEGLPIDLNTVAARNYFLCKRRT